MDSNTTADHNALREKDVEAEAARTRSPLGISNKEESSHTRRSSSDEEDLTDGLDWNSDDDPGNPQNWPKAKKTFHTLLPALYGFVM